MALSEQRRKTPARAFVAHVLVLLLLLHSSLAAVGAMRAYDGSTQATLSGVICSASGLATGDDPTPPSPSVYHCVLCSIAQGGCGPTVPPSLVAPPPRLAFFEHVYGRAQETRALRPSGWASSWSSRAPPFAA